MNSKEDSVTTIHRKDWCDWISLKITMAGLVLAFACALSLFKPWSSVIHSENSPTFHPITDNYSIVFDGGSTGSRVFTFHFKIGKKVLLANEIFLSIEPGISSYARNPEKAAESLKPLLESAVNSVPSDMHHTTGLIFKATAGLRLLEKTVRDGVMKEVKNLIRTSPFYVPNMDKIEVMGGTEEGLFGWTTINFLLDTLWTKKSQSTVATLDLGGGSLQLTYELPRNTEPMSYCGTEIGEIYLMKILKESFYVYTKSFLKYGLKSARLHIMGGWEDPEDERPPGGKEDPAMLTLSSPCFVPGFKDKWVHGMHTYTILGKPSTTSRYLACQEFVNAYVQSGGFAPSPELKGKDMHLFSYFFDVAKWGGIIPKHSHMEILTPRDFDSAAQKYCQDSAFSNHWPFQCMDILFIHSLLSVGLELPANKPLQVENQLGGREVSWTLGAALATVSHDFAFDHVCPAQ